MNHQHVATATDGTSIAWSARDASGTAPTPVVLVHGITESAASWEPVTERLAATHHVITLDLRGHGESGEAGTYDLAAMADDVATVVAAAGLERPHLVGHSLGGAVVTALGASADVASVVDVDQSLRLDAFKEMLAPAEAMIRDPAQYEAFVDAMFAAMWGDRIDPEVRARIDAARGAPHDVILGAWGLILDEPVETIAATVDAVLAGYAARRVPYLAVFGIDPGDGYDDWLRTRVPGAQVENWAADDEGLGHYPHLVDPDRFVARLHDLWTA